MRIRLRELLNDIQDCFQCCRWDNVYRAHIFSVEIIISRVKATGKMKRSF